MISLSPSTPVSAPVRSAPGEAGPTLENGGEPTPGVAKPGFAALLEPRDLAPPAASTRALPAQVDLPGGKQLPDFAGSALQGGPAEVLLEEPDPALACALPMAMPMLPLLFAQPASAGQVISSLQPAVSAQGAISIIWAGTTIAPRPAGVPSLAGLSHVSLPADQTASPAFTFAGGAAPLDPAEAPAPTPRAFAAPHDTARIIASAVILPDEGATAPFAQGAGLPTAQLIEGKTPGAMRTLASAASEALPAAALPSERLTGRVTGRDALRTRVQATPALREIGAPPSALAIATPIHPTELPAATTTSYPATPLVPGTATQPFPAAHDLSTVIDRLVEARQAAFAGSVRLSVAHEEFGAVAIRFDHPGGTAQAQVSLTSRDPDFAPTVQAALAERGAPDRQPSGETAQPGRGDLPAARGENGAQQQGQSQPRPEPLQNGDHQQPGSGAASEAPRSDATPTEATYSTGRVQPRRLFA